ncbi:hypothetical protein SJ05684_c24330 [Sinorhizobium sojae CCBAU 05684]|uniref:Mobile element protein n=1 Tax=Sinorhizobium sojae CCBAU 05684 TaxID=716928 RepID=A0A249PD77_9HYPH|nr:hypothetical protein SJ05684_c24330 [Sinorhizobium sojae CCBAU 05684]
MHASSNAKPPARVFAQADCRHHMGDIGQLVKGRSPPARLRRR